MARRIELATGEAYHVYNRGVDSRNIFPSEDRFQRFYESMYLFNDANFDGSGDGWIKKMAELLTVKATEYDIRDRLVDIVAFNLMDNHFHLELVQLKDEGISKFMHKLQMGYSRVFNSDHERRGSLFNRPFEAVLVDSDAYAEFLPIYIHLNELDRFGISWRDGKVENWDEVIKLMGLYKWSSHNVALGQPQELPVVNEKYLKDIYTSPQEYLEFLRQWSTRYAGTLKEIEVKFSDDVTRNTYKH